jgi:hypothetical protein
VSNDIKTSGSNLCRSAQPAKAVVFQPGTISRDEPNDDGIGVGFWQFSWIIEAKCSATGESLFSLTAVFAVPNNGVPS